VKLLTLARAIAKSPSFPQSVERESATREIADIGARHSQTPSFPQSLERESAARKVAGVRARYSQTPVIPAVS
jgi:hypothetical protein